MARPTPPWYGAISAYSAAVAGVTRAASCTRRSSGFFGGRPPGCLGFGVFFLMVVCVAPSCGAVADGQDVHFSPVIPAKGVAPENGTLAGAFAIFTQRTNCMLLEAWHRGQARSS